MGETKRHIQHSYDLVGKVEEIEIEEVKVITSFDVTALFTSLPGNEVVQVAIQRAKGNQTWEAKILMVHCTKGVLRFAKNGG